MPDLRAPSNLLTADELAIRLRRSRDRVYRRAHAGDLPGALRFDSGWRFREADIDAWLARREQSHSQPEGRVWPRKTAYVVKITVRRPTQDAADSRWTCPGRTPMAVAVACDGRPRTSRRFEPSWAEELIEEQLGPDALPKLEALEDSPMFADFVPRFLALCESAAAGRRGTNSDDEVANKRSIIEHHLEPFFGHMQLTEIGPSQIDAYACEKATERSKRTGKPLTGSTMANHLGLLRRMLEVAHRWNLISKVPELILPCKGLIENYLTPRETRALLDKLDPLFRDLVLVAVRTGMRLGELRELRVGDIELRGARIRVKRQRTQRGQVKAPKVARRERFRSQSMRPQSFAFAPAASIVATWCSAIRLDTLPPPRRRAGARRRAVSHRDVIGAVKRSATAAKLGRSIGVHTLRHTFATHAVAAGVPLAVAGPFIG